MSNEAFYYVDGQPTKGAWCDLESVTEDDIKEVLADAGVIERNEDGEIEYDGDLLVADVDGDLARCFLGKHGTFDLDGFHEANDFVNSRGGPDEAAVVAYINWRGSFSQSDFEDSYQGEYEDEESFAESIVDDLYNIPDSLQGYIDYEKFARDLFMGDYYYEDGHVFRNT